jgi:hypothetical protein
VERDISERDADDDGDHSVLLEVTGSGCGQMRSLSGFHADRRRLDGTRDVRADCCSYTWRARSRRKAGPEQRRHASGVAACFSRPSWLGAGLPICRPLGCKTSSGDMTVAISAAALAVSLSSFLATFLTARRRDKRDLLLRLHDRLTTADQQRGGRLVYVMSEDGKRVQDLSGDEYELINNALASLSTLGIYYQRRYVPRKALMELWAETVLRLMRSAEPFLAHRDAIRRGSVWPELQMLAEESRKYVRKQGKDPTAVEASGRTLPGSPTSLT